jgi:hypothetical protein
LVIALTMPKLTMNEVTAAVEASWNVSLPISGTSVRSSPTMPPTNALISTSSVNCCQFSRSPSAMRASLIDAVLAASATAGYSAAAACRPLFQARNSAAPTGGGGMSVNMNLTNSSAGPMRKAALCRRSNPMVEDGLPLNRRPQTEPA